MALMLSSKLSETFALIADFESCLTYFFFFFLLGYVSSQFFSGLWLSNTILLARFMLPRYV